MSEVENPVVHRPQQTIKQLDQARSQSSWLVWFGIGLAVLWWAAGIAGTLSLFGWPTLSAAAPTALVAGGFALFIPGAMLTMAGFMAHEHKKAAETNAVVLEAAARLLTPAERAGDGAQAFADQMVQATAEVDRAMGHALSAMKAMAGEIGDERQRLESVTYASADNARDLAVRLELERTGLEKLAKDLREQANLINDAIPRQSEQMVESAKAAANEVARAESGLEHRLNTLDQTGRSLAQKIAAMDTLAAEAGQRNETLLFAIARMEEKLEQSRKTVETASRAGELAAAAAGTTGDRLLEAVRTALDGAREASAEIQKRTLESSEAAAKSLAGLKDAGKQAAAAVRAAGMAARAEMDIAERRAYVASNPNVGNPPSPQRPVVRSSEPVAEDKAEPSVSFVSAPKKPVAEASKPEETEIEATPPVSPSQAVEDDLFEMGADRMAQAMLQTAEDELKAERAEPVDVNAAEDNADIEIQDAVFDEIVDEPEEVDVLDGGPLPPLLKTNGNSLSEIIADMEREERPTLSREETAEGLVTRLEDSGIRLTEVFRPRDKKRVAAAARKGEVQRKTAINQTVGRQVDRVRKRLATDSELMLLARDFLALEESDALNALENTYASNKNASARLATYLLIDAALN
ncbi:MAG: hypothetical protein QNI84_04675 [Henriciella sp.]|nr:hypothetical protein [Henriciella sp.]